MQRSTLTAHVPPRLGKVVSSSGSVNKSAALAGLLRVEAQETKWTTWRTDWGRATARPSPSFTTACADRVHHYLVVRLRCREDADEVLQETLVRLARAHKKLAEVDNVMAYVFKVAQDGAARLAGQRARRQENEARFAAETLFVDGDHRDSQLREIAEVVAIGLSRLDADRREVVELKTYAGLTFAEIAEVTGLPGTRNALSDGMARSAAAIEEGNAMNDDVEAILKQLTPRRRTGPRCGRAFSTPSPSIYPTRRRRPANARPLADFVGMVGWQWAWRRRC